MGRGQAIAWAGKTATVSPIMKTISAALVALVVGVGCGPVWPGTPIGCGPLAEIPAECIPADDSEVLVVGCGGAEWQVSQSGCAAVPVDFATDACRDGHQVCPDGDALRCSAVPLPTAEQCAEMMARCEAESCRFPVGG